MRNSGSASGSENGRPSTGGGGEAAREAVLKGDAAVDAEYLRKVFRNVVPLSKTNPEAIDSIRAWGRERAVPASGVPMPASEGQPRARRSVLV